MILSRLVSMIFRFVEFVCAAVVLGLSAYFLHKRNDHEIYTPRGRIIYTLVLSCVSLVLSLIWLIPFTASMLHYPADLVIALGWFASFGALVNWIGDTTCGNTFHWGIIGHGGFCGKYKAMEAFAFIAACFWLASALLGMYVFHRLRREGGPSAVATDGAARRRRWYDRSRV